MVLRKFERKYEKKKIKRKNGKNEKIKENLKNTFKVNKLFLYVTSNSFYLFNFLI